MKCNKPCRFNDRSSVCMKPSWVPCPMQNIAPVAKDDPPMEKAERVIAVAKAAARGRQKKKTNPRRIPASQADINKVRRELKQAKTEVTGDAVSLAISMFLTVLCDKFGYDAESLQAVWAEVNNLSDSVVKGYVNVEDLKQVLREEYGIEIT